MLKISQIISRINTIIDKQISLLVVALMILLSILLSVSVFYRYVLNDSIYWSNEVARYMLVYIVFLGATMAHKHKSHIRIDIILGALSHKNKKYIEMLIGGLFIFFWILVLMGSLKLLPLFLMQKTATLEIPFAYPFAALPLSACIWILYCIDDIIRECVKK
ncbi:TRAP transporter small permease [Sulfurospirillum sp. 1612]|uniref:TRAP transporter small permease n=1 Tax=Sulfurospirillum sp. 1612 TaxID=3094835 RepID=UPI002F92B5A6